MGDFYDFFLNMWIMKRISQDELTVRVTRGRITQDEYNTIIATQQVT